MLQLLRFGGTFRNKDLAAVLQVSPQYCAVLLRQLVALGEIQRMGRNRGTKYCAGPGLGVEGYGTARGDEDEEGVWHHLAAHVPEFAYARASRTGLLHLRTRNQVKQILLGLERRRFVILDLQDIQTVSFAFADEVVNQWQRWFRMRIETINTNEQVRRMLELAKKRPPPDPLQSRRVPDGERTTLEQRQAQMREMGARHR